MNLDTLINKLMDIRDRFEDEGGADFNINVALQPNYPLIGRLLNVCVDADENRVFLAVSDAESYGCPQDAWSESEIYHDEEE